MAHKVVRDVNLGHHIVYNPSTKKLNVSTDRGLETDPTSYKLSAKLDDETLGFTASNEIEVINHRKLSGIDLNGYIDPLGIFEVEDTCTNLPKDKITGDVTHGTLYISKPKTGNIAQMLVGSDNRVWTRLKIGSVWTKWESERYGAYTYDVTVTVGSGGDFATLNEALTEVSKRYPRYKKSGYSVEIKLKSGFVMNEQVLIQGLDLDYITITGEDAYTQVPSSALTTKFWYVYPAFGVFDGSLPVIKHAFRMTGSDASRSGLVVAGNGSATLLLDGTKRPGFTRFTETNITVMHTSSLYAENADLLYSKLGIYVRDTATATTYRANCSACEKGVAVDYHGTFLGDRTTANSCTTAGILAMGESTARIGLATFNNCRIGIEVGGNGSVFAYGTTINDATEFGAYAYHNSSIQLELGNVKNAGTKGVYAMDNASIYVSRAKVDGCPVNYAALWNARIHGQQLNSVNAGSLDYAVLYGAVISIGNPSGGTSGNIAWNTWTDNGQLLKH